MRSLIAVLALGGVFLAEAPVMAQRRFRDAEAAGQGWLGSLAEGKRLARETGRPLMVVLRCVP
jgi:hypothetical protein